MQAFEQEKSSLRRAIRHCLDRIGWWRGKAAARAQLARDFGMRPDVASSILDRTAAELRKLSTSGDENFDACPIIARAVQELGELGYQSQPFEDQAMERCLQELPEPDYQILRHFKQGKKHNDIAELMGTDVDSVRCSLIRTYAELRVRMISTNNGGGGVPAETLRSQDEPMKRTSVST